MYVTVKSLSFHFINCESFSCFHAGTYSSRDTLLAVLVELLHLYFPRRQKDTTANQEYTSYFYINAPTRWRPKIHTKAAICPTWPPPVPRCRTMQATIQQYHPSQNLTRRPRTQVLKLPRSYHGRRSNNPVPGFHNQFINAADQQGATANAVDMPRTVKDTGETGEVITGTGDQLPASVESKRLGMGEAGGPAAKGNLRDARHDVKSGSGIERFASDGAEVDPAPGEEEEEQDIVRERKGL